MTDVATLTSRRETKDEGLETDLTCLQPHTAGPALNLEAIRADFPILHQQVRGKPLVYLDNAATTQKPQVVIDTLNEYYGRQNANIHRGVHFLSEVATREFEEARVKAKRFLNARDAHEVIFVRGCTEAINLVASTYGR